MMSSLGTHACICSLGVPEHLLKGRSCRILCFRYIESSCKALFSSKSQLFTSNRPLNARNCWPIFSAATDDANEPDDSEDSKDKEKPQESEIGSVNSEILRDKLERFIGRDDSAFSGIDLATLIRTKYGRSYDVQLIKKEFLGKNLLALNVMWKYMEQRSFPLTEEEYLLRLDDVANTLKCWGAVSHVRNTLEKSKERPRIGKGMVGLTPFAVPRPCYPCISYVGFQQ